MSDSLAKSPVMPPVCGAGHYLLALVEQGRAVGWASAAQIESLGTRLAALFDVRAQRKLAGDSTSMRAELARDVVDGVLYTLGLYLKAMPDPRKALALLCSEDLNDLYKKARHMLEQRVQSAKRLWRATVNTGLATPSICYRETLQDGIGAFFTWYDMDFAAQETPGDIDYPLAVPLVDGGGVEYIETWLERLLLENRFCRRFVAGDIHQLLLRGGPDYTVLVLNLFEPTLLCAIGAVLTGANPALLAPTNARVQALAPAAAKSQAAAAKQLANGAKSLCDGWALAPEDPLRAYVAAVAKQNAATCHAAAKSGSLSAFFYAVCK